MKSPPREQLLYRVEPNLNHKLKLIEHWPNVSIIYFFDFHLKMKLTEALYAECLGPRGILSFYPSMYFAHFTTQWATHQFYSSKFNRFESSDLHTLSLQAFGLLTIWRHLGHLSPKGCLGYFLHRRWYIRQWEAIWLKRRIGVNWE